MFCCNISFSIGKGDFVIGWNQISSLFYHNRIEIGLHADLFNCQFKSSWAISLAKLRIIGKTQMLKIMITFKYTRSLTLFLINGLIAIYIHCYCNLQTLSCNKYLNEVSQKRLANRGRLFLRTPGPVPFETCVCSHVETILSWTCHVYGPFEFRTFLGSSISR